MKNKKYEITRPSKQCEFCIYLDKSFDQSRFSEWFDWSRWLVGPGGPGGLVGPGGPGVPDRHGGQGVRLVRLVRWSECQVVRRSRWSGSPGGKMVRAVKPNPQFISQSYEFTLQAVSKTMMTEAGYISSNKR